MKVLVRTTKEFDLEDICSHLLVVGELTGDCFNCKELGLDYANIKKCPKCSAEFKFIASRRQNFNLKFLFQLKNKRPDLEYIEFIDLKHHKDREKARDFLS